MPSLGDIGSALSGAGALASGFGFGSGDAPEVDYKGAKKGIRWRVRDARKAGIHPLYAMGAPGVGSGILSGGSAGTDPGAAMQGVGNAMTTYQQARMQEKFNQANLEKIQAETDFIREQQAASRASRNAQGLVHSSKSGDVYTYPAKGPYKPQVIGPAFVDVVMPDGSTRTIGNQEVGLENPELMVPWFMFQDWLNRKGGEIRKYFSDIGTDWRSATQGLIK